MGMSGDTALIQAKRYVKKTLQGQGALKGQDGFSPTVKENPNNTADDYRFDVTDKNGTFTTPNLKGYIGADGFSPTATVTKDGNVTTITLTDKNGTTSEMVYDGQTNVIESVTVNGAAVPIDDKTVNIDLTGYVKKEDGKTLVSNDDVAQISKNKDDIAILNGTGDGSVDKKIADKLSEQTYLTKEIASADEINAYISNPSTAKFNVIYLLKDDSTKGADKYFEYQRIGTEESSEFVMTGDTSTDLSDYAKKTDVETVLENYSTTEAMNTVIEQSAKDVKDEVSETYATKTQVNGVESQITTNLLKPTLATTTQNGVTCTNNGDGTYTLNGTATAMANFKLNGISIKKGKPYKLVGCPKGRTLEGNKGYKMYIGQEDYPIDYGDGVLFTPLNDVTTTVIQINKDVEIHDLIFKPMITTNLNADYSMFVSYTGSTGQLNSDVASMNNDLSTNFSHNIPRLIPKDITSYYTDGTLWQRLNGTNGFSLYEDIYVGDYFKMSRPISAYNQDKTQQATGSDYVTIAGIGTLYGNGDSKIVDYEHLVMIPGKGFGGTQHFGKSRMNPTNTTVGGYAGSEMFTTTIGAVASSGSTELTATINQQLYAEFGSHLKTTREMLSNSINESGYNRLGTNSGFSNGWDWYDCQAVLMSEVEVYGSTMWSSSGYDTGNAKLQLPLFANNRSAMNNRSSWYWLKDVASASSFCDCSYYGYGSYGSAGNAIHSVRPRFVIA